MGSRRVLRGGSWNNNARRLRSAYRNHREPGNRNNNAGFRLARARGASDGAVRPDLHPVRFLGKRQKASGARHVSRVADAPESLPGGHFSS